MKQYTTPCIKINIPGKADLLQSADRIVLCVSSNGSEAVIDGDRINISGACIEARLTESETAAMSGEALIEATLFADELIYKTKTIKTTVEEALWNNTSDGD